MAENKPGREKKGTNRSDLRLVAPESEAPHTAEQKANGSSHLIVGIGASAGGLEAFRTFLENMPADSGMAFVLVQHLAPDHKSMLAEILAKTTAMTVAEAVDGAEVLPNHVFVIPPDATLTIANGRLVVIKPAPPREHLSAQPLSDAAARYASPEPMRPTSPDAAAFQSAPVILDARCRERERWRVSDGVVN